MGDRKGRRAERQKSVEREERRTAGVPAYRLTPLPPEEAFEKEILVKSEVADVLARTLNPARLAGHSLVIGTATDPYQPAERRFRLTRRILEVSVVSRAFDRDYHQVAVGDPRSRCPAEALRPERGKRQHFLATADARLARRLELRSPVPAARLRALAGSRRGGFMRGSSSLPSFPASPTTGPGWLGFWKQPGRRAPAM